jgi:hypothetical protein
MTIVTAVSGCGLPRCRSWGTQCISVPDLRDVLHQRLKLPNLSLHPPCCFRSHVPPPPSIACPELRRRPVNSPVRPSETHRENSRCCWPAARSTASQLMCPKHPHTISRNSPASSAAPFSLAMPPPLQLLAPSRAPTHPLYMLVGPMLQRRAQQSLQRR